jgi:hypothetical protein
VAKELDRDQYGVIRHHPEERMLELEWLDASENMTDDDFKRSMQRFAALAAEQSTPHMLVDVTKFRFTPGEGVGRARHPRLPRRRSGEVRVFAASGRSRDGRAWGRTGEGAAGPVSDRLLH